MARASKLIAKYTPQAKQHNERCELCMHFLPPDSCSRVVGEIKPEGWCRFFAKKDIVLRFADKMEGRK